jgi:hypothetical protein
MGDRKKMESLLAEGFTFTSPYHDHIGRAQYFERCWPEQGRIHTHHIASLMSKGDEALVAYECELTNGTSSRSVERLIFDGNRIRAIELYAGDPPMGIPKADYAEFETVALRHWEEDIMLPGTKAAGTTD